MADQLILHCEENIDGMLTAIYDAFVYKKEMHEYADNITISVGDNTEQLLFANEIEVRTDATKAEKTAKAISNQLGFSVYHTVIRVLCHFDQDRASVVLGYLVRAFSKGNQVWECLTDPYVMRMMEMNRKVNNECEKFMGFTRFRQLGSFLYAEIEPKCDAIQVMREHFEDRYPGENFVIYDVRRKYALVHRAHTGSVFVSGEAFFEQLTEEEVDQIARRDDYEELWRVYFDTMGIEERENERCQNTLLPKWYRKHMIEFTSAN